MKEAISTRVGRLIAGSVNALINAVEDAAPEMVMEQALREIDGATDDVRAELGKVLATRHLATKRLAEENQKHETLGDQIELAVAQNREDLAEAAIGWATARRELVNIPGRPVDRAALLVSPNDLTKIGVYVRVLIPLAAGLVGLAVSRARTNAA